MLNTPKKRRSSGGSDSPGPSKRARSRSPSPKTPTPSVDALQMSPPASTDSINTLLRKGPAVPTAHPATTPLSSLTRRMRALSPVAESPEPPSRPQISPENPSPATATPTPALVQASASPEVVVVRPQESRLQRVSSYLSIAASTAVLLNTPARRAVLQVSKDLVHAMLTVTLNALCNQ